MTFVKKKREGFTRCDVCSHLKTGVRACDVLDPISWRSTRVKACQPCRAKRKLRPVDFTRGRPTAW